jgi:hypothetical protein
MAKRRTKQDIAYNEKLLDRLWERNHKTGNCFTITFIDLVGGGYRGSLPYTIPSAVGEKYIIKQNKRIRNSSYTKTTYSVIKM